MFNSTQEKAAKAISDIKVSLNVGVIIAGVALLVATVALVVAIGGRS